MAVLATNYLTFADWAARRDIDGSLADVINLLSQTNDILKSALVLEGNLPTGNLSTLRTSLPAVTWRRIYQGVAPSKSTTAQITDTVGNLQGYSQVDKDLADLNGNTTAFRMSEDMPFMEAMSQAVAQTVFYGNTDVNPERFMGLAARYNTVSTATSPLAANVIDAGGTGSVNSSIWIITWSPDTAYLFFPKGKTSGFQMEDKGSVNTLYDANNRPFEGYTTHFKWEVGLTVRDWRYIVRIANIDTTNLNAGTGANLLNALVRGVNRMPTTSIGVGPVQAGDTTLPATGQTCIYVNRTVRTALDLQAMNKTNVWLQQGQWGGMPIMNFRGIPIFTVDAILSTEARVV